MEGEGKGNVLEVTSTCGLVSANFQSSRSAMTDAAVCRHQGCNPSLLQSSSVWGFQSGNMLLAFFLGINAHHAYRFR